MPRPTLLLVHGAWHGSWFWEPLISELGEFDVRTVDLPSCTGGPDELGGLEDDAETVRAAIAGINGPVVVVAHSYGGLPVSEGVSGTAGGQVTHLVYLCAFMLDAGESLLAAAGGTRRRGGRCTSGTSSRGPPKPSSTTTWTPPPRRRRPEGSGC